MPPTGSLRHNAGARQSEAGRPSSILCRRRPATRQPRSSSGGEGRVLVARRVRATTLQPRERSVNAPQLTLGLNGSERLSCPGFFGGRTTRTEVATPDPQRRGRSKTAVTNSGLGAFQESSFGFARRTLFPTAQLAPAPLLWRAVNGSTFAPHPVANLPPQIFQCEEDRALARRYGLTLLEVHSGRNVGVERSENSSGTRYHRRSSHWRAFG